MPSNHKMEAHFTSLSLDKIGNTKCNLDLSRGTNQPTIILFSPPRYPNVSVWQKGDGGKEGGREGAQCAQIYPQNPSSV